jgi:membrane protein implicated in regulation of membrane protease activity
VEQDLCPGGSVRLGAEYWSARLLDGVEPQVRGTPVQVKAVEGYVVVVAPVGSDGDEPPGLERQQPEG